MPIDFVTAPPFPTLSERGAVDLGLVNGVDPRNLVLGANADATITFRDEIAAFRNTLGVVLIGDDGSLGAARIVFANVEHADALPQFPFARPGGGPLHPGDEVRLSQLYGADALVEGQQFAFFTVADGFRLNGNLTGAELVFRNADGSPATIADPPPALFAERPDGTLVPLAGNVFHTATPTVDAPLDNALNDGGRGQVLSGLENDVAGLTITFEDKTLNFGDTDCRQRLQRRDLRGAARARHRQLARVRQSGRRGRCHGRRRRCQSERRGRRDHRRRAARRRAAGRPAARERDQRGRGRRERPARARRHRIDRRLCRRAAQHQARCRDRGRARDLVHGHRRARRRERAGRGAGQPHHRGRAVRHRRRRHPDRRAGRQRRDRRPARRRSAVRPVGQRRARRRPRRRPARRRGRQRRADRRPGQRRR